MLIKTACKTYCHLIKSLQIDDNTTTVLNQATAYKLIDIGCLSLHSNFLICFINKSSFPKYLIISTRTHMYIQYRFNTCIQSRLQFTYLILSCVLLDLNEPHIKTNKKFSRIRNGKDRLRDYCKAYLL
jgi:hypothetical protein